MTADTFQGPLVTAGNMMDFIGGAEQKTSIDAGPSIFYRGDSFPDVRYAPLNKDAAGQVGVVPAFATTQVQRAINVVPSAVGSGGNIVAPANPATGVAMTLAAASAGIATGVPFLQFGTNTIITANMALDMGFDSANVTSGSNNITVASTLQYKIGQPICIANVGNSGGTTALLTFITGITSATVFTVNNAPAATNSATPIDTALPGWGNIINMPPALPSYCAPYIEGGFGLFYDSRRVFARGISVTGVASGSGGAVGISGYDGWGNLQNETITLGAGSNTVNSVKTWKYITSVTPAFTDTHNISVNTIDVFGLPLYSQFFEETKVFFNSTVITANTGYTAGVTTSPATKTTGDPRGKYATQSATDGTKRLVIYQLPSFYEMGANPSSYAKLYGVTPV